MTPRIEQPDQSIEAEVLKAETQAAMDTLQELQAQFEVVSAEARFRWSRILSMADEIGRD